MIANIRNFGNMDMNDANRELKENLKAVKSQAEALEHGMDLMIRRIDFEPEEIGKWGSVEESTCRLQDNRSKSEYCTKCNDFS